MLDAAVHRVGLAHQGACPFQIADDHAHRLRREHREPGEVGIGYAGIGRQHGQGRELRLRHAEFVQCPVHPQPVGTSRLSQQIAEVAFLAALAFAGGGNRG